MNIVIRKANKVDLNKIQELNYRLFEYEYNYNSSLNMEWTFSEKGETYFNGLIEKGTIWIAQDNDRIVGYLAGNVIGNISYTTKRIAEIDNFYIDKDYRRKGIGKKLVQKFKDYCIHENIEEIKVTTNNKNIDAKEFYKNNGFEEYEVTYKIKIDE